jgi:hypothetical protein
MIKNKKIRKQANTKQNKKQKKKGEAWLYLE